MTEDDGMKSTVRAIYDGSESAFDFFQQYIVQIGINAPERYLREVMLMDAEDNGRHLFHMSFKEVGGKKYLFVGDKMSLVQWAPFDCVSLILLTQDMDTIRYLINTGVFDDASVLKTHRRMILYTANLDIIKSIELKCDDDMFREDYLARYVYPIVCRLIHYIMSNEELYEYHLETLNLFISILTSKMEIQLPMIESKDSLAPALFVFLSDNTYELFIKRIPDVSNDHIIIEFREWREHVIRQIHG